MIMDDLIELRNDLKPIYDFTTSCEIENANQADLYIYYRSLKAQLIMRMTPRANRLLELVKSRFKSTLDIKISKLCYFTTNRGIKEKQERFPHVSANEALKNKESQEKFDNEVGFFEKFSEVIQYLCSKLEFDETLILNSFETLLKCYFPSNDDIHKFPKARDIRTLMKKNSGESESYIAISEFIEIIQTLPASESAAERIFARMRDLLNIKQTRLSAESLQSQIILSFYADQIKKENIE